MDFGTMTLQDRHEALQQELAEARAEVERLRAACQELLNALAGARAAADNWYRSGHDEAAGMDMESAEATAIIKENAVRALLT